MLLTQNGEQQSHTSICGNLQKKPPSKTVTEEGAEITTKTETKRSRNKEKKHLKQKEYAGGRNMELVELQLKRKLVKLWLQFWASNDQTRVTMPERWDVWNGCKVAAISAQALIHTNGMQSLNRKIKTLVQESLECKDRKGRHQNVVGIHRLTSRD